MGLTASEEVVTPWNAQTPFRAGAGHGDDGSGALAKTQTNSRLYPHCDRADPRQRPKQSPRRQGDVEGVDIALGLGEASKRLGPSAARVVRKVEACPAHPCHAPVLC